METKAAALPRPRLIGRSIRLIAGAYLLYVVVDLLAYYRIGQSPSPYNFVAWIGLAIALYILPAVVNLGFSRSWGRWPQIAAGAILVAAGLFDLASSGQFLGPLFGATFMMTIVYAFGHLGLSFVTAAALAAPG